MGNIKLTYQSTFSTLNLLIKQYLQYETYLSNKIFNMKLTYQTKMS